MVEPNGKRKQVRLRKLLVSFNMRENSKNKPVDHFIFFDTETNQERITRTINKRKIDTVCNTLQMGWGCYYNRVDDSEYWFYFEDIDSFWYECRKIINRTKGSQIWFVAHNIVFDNIILNMWEFMKSLKFESEFIHNKGMVFIQKFKKGSKTIYFVNNGNIFPAKLEVIGKTIGLDKMKVDFEKDSKDYVKAYCKRDVEILVVFWKQWINFIDTNGLGKLKFTISSQSMESFKKRFCQHYITLDDDIDNLEFERLSYYGGRTECFYVGKVKTPIYYYDVNSMYPFVMEGFRYPREYKFTHECPSVKYVMELVEKGWLIVAECYLDTDQNCYPVRDGELIFPVGKIKTFLSTPEVIYAYEHGHLKRFGKVSYYKGDNLFKDYVNFFYNKRQELKKAGNKQESMYKLFLNSLYGKFGQKNDKWEKTDEGSIYEFFPDFDLGEWVMGFQKLERFIMNGIDMTPRIRYIGGELQMSCEETESNISFPAIASHVTSYARMTLWKYIDYCHKNNIKVYYCDTDSIFTDKPMEGEFVSDSILGKIKLEKIFENGVQFKGLKNYSELDKDGEIIYDYVDEDGNTVDKEGNLLNENNEFIRVDGETLVTDSKVIKIKGKKWKLKGVSNNAEIIDENTFFQQEWSGLPKQEYFKKFGRKDGEYWILYITKHSYETIKKGDLQRSGDVKPFKLKMW